MMSALGVGTVAKPVLPSAPDTLFEHEQQRKKEERTLPGTSFFLVFYGIVPNDVTKSHLLKTEKSSKRREEVTFYIIISLLHYFYCYV